MAKNNAIDIDIETGGGNTYTFPSATSTLASLDLAETLTNKDLSDASNTLGSANVTAAGALMESEVINLAQVKAFDSTDYAAALGADDNYVTDAEKTVIGNTSGTNTGDQDLSGLAVKTNVLELNNTTAFTPDADYEPATKKYVDDNAGGVAIETTTGATHSLTTSAGQTVVVWAKGSFTGSSFARDITMSYGGVIKDTVVMEAAGSSDEIPFSLMYTESPSAGTANVTVEAASATLQNVVIIVQIIG